MFDIFYYGEKPNLFAFEKPAVDLADAARQAKTRCFWYIYGDNDYTGFNFDYTPLPWEQDHLHVWPTQWNEFGGAFLVCTEFMHQQKYHHHAQVIKAKPSSTNWVNLTKIKEFDYSWKPHPFDPPFIYVFGNQWHSAERMPTVEYHVPGATDRKYVHNIHAIISENSDNWVVNTEHPIKYDASWCPDPFDPPHIYVFGNQWYSSEIMPTVEYHVPGATERKYMDYPRVELLPNAENWEFPDTINASELDCSWVPDPGDPAYIYHFASEWQESSGVKYVVPGATEIKMMGPAPSKSGHLTQIPTIFFIDKGNPLASSRLIGYKDLGIEVVKTRYVNSMMDTIKRCANRSKTNLFWVISSENDYDEFDFTWHPNSWQYGMTHVFGSKWSKWTDTFLMNKHEFLRHSAWAKDIDQFPNLNFVQDQLVKTSEDSSAMYYVDHGNPESQAQLEKFKDKYPNIRTTRFVDNYLDTFKRIIATATTEYVWIVSSACNYEKFDFTWQPGAWEREQIHCFCNNDGSWNEKRGDTFYIPVEIFKAQMYELELLDWFNVISYNASQTVTRWDIPVVEYDSDNLIEVIKNYEFNTPYVLFANRDFAGSMGENVVDCLWTEKDRTVRPYSMSGGIVLVPRDVKKYLKTQMYDYPYLYKYDDGLPYNYYADNALDVVFVSNGEPEEERLYKHLCTVLEQKHIAVDFPKFCNKVHWVRNVKGRVASEQAAAHASTTKWYFRVPAKLEVLQEFNFNWQPDYWQGPKHYIFNAQNAMNGLEYGHMGIVACNRNLVLKTNDPGLDFIMSQPHESVPKLCGVAHYNQDSLTTWRTAFREVLKLRMFMDTQPSLETEHRLKIWSTVATGNYSNYSIDGANHALEYYEEVKGDPAKLQLSFEWAWLNQYYNSKYN